MMVVSQSSSPEAVAVLQLLQPLGRQAVRVTVMDPTSRERVFRVAGVLVCVSTDLLSVECTHPCPTFPPEAPSTLEILTSGEILFCHTRLHPVQEGRGRLDLVPPESIQTEQRRKYPRVDLSVPVHVVTGPSGKVLQAQLRDLSAGGAALALQSFLEPGSLVGLVFTLGSGLFFEDLEGEVLRCTPSQSGGWLVGLQFTCNDEKRDLLANWVNRRLRESRA